MGRAPPAEATQAPAQATQPAVRTTATAMRAPVHRSTTPAPMVHSAAQATARAACASGPQ